MAEQLDFLIDGARRFGGLVLGEELDALRRVADVHGGVGARVFDDPRIAIASGSNGVIGAVATRLGGRAMRPVRAVLFDKTPAANWAVGWHQDRTISVQSRVETAGFGPWSVKAGVPHVEPPFALMQRMITLRVHIDDCGADNAPLRIALGSHRLGMVAASEAAEVASQGETFVCEALAGDVWAYATPILHASERALKPARRRVLQVDYCDAVLPNGLAWRGLAESRLA